MVNTILAKRVNHIVAKGDSPAWPKGSKSRGFSIPFREVVVHVILGKGCVNMLFAVIVELADAHFGYVVLTTIVPYPFGADLVAFGHLFGDVVFCNVEIVFRANPLIWLGFQHQFNVSSAYHGLFPTDTGGTKFVFFDQLINVLACDTHQQCRL